MKFGRFKKIVMAIDLPDDAEVYIAVADKRGRETLDMRSVTEMRLQSMNALVGSEAPDLIISSRIR